MFQENPALVHLFTDAALLERSRLNIILFSIHLIYRVGWSQVGPQRQQGLPSATWDILPSIRSMWLEKIVTIFADIISINPCFRISNHLVSAMGDDDEGVAVPSRTLLLQVRGPEGALKYIDNLICFQLIAKLPEETQASWATIRTGRLQVLNKN